MMAMVSKAVATGGRARIAMATPTAPSTKSDEAHEGEQASGGVKAVGDGGARLAVVADLGVGERGW